jgi:Protein of unknown function (DUF2894)
MTELRAEFNALKTACGAQDPVRLRFIESLLQKAENGRGALAEVLEVKLRKAIDDYRKLESGAGEVSQTTELTTRTRELNHLTQVLNSMQGDEHDSQAAPLDQALRQQELDLVDAVAVEAQQSGANVQARQEELRAARRFHSAMTRLNAEKVVAQAIAEVPEESGPLNPQRLATSSLEVMKDLSPHYLNRFVSYVDTLFWLESAGRGGKR